MTHLIIWLNYLFLYIIIGQHLTNFEIDGNLVTEKANGIDWLSVAIATRNTTNDDKRQNGCIQTGYTSTLWKSSVFCDSFGNNENSVPSNGAALANATTWAPFITGSAPSKGDITNIYVVGDPIDNTLCAAFERKGQTGTVYTDMEFNQDYNKRADCSYAGTSQDWRCWYNIRTQDDFRTSFVLKGSNSFDIYIYQYNSSFGDYILIKQSSGTGILNTPSVKAAVNNISITAASWGHIDSQGVVQPTIPADKFFEACINFTALGFGEFCFSAVIVTSKSSDAPSAQLTDSSGLIRFQVCGSAGETHAPTPSPTDPGQTYPPTPPTGNPTPSPTDIGQTPQPTPSPSLLPTPSPTKTDPPSPSPTIFPTSVGETFPPTMPTTPVTTTTAASSTTNTEEEQVNKGDSKGSLTPLLIGLIIGGGILLLLLIGGGIWYYRKKASDNSWYA